jgi:hypothetical protein
MNLGSAQYQEVDESVWLPDGASIDPETGEIVLSQDGVATDELPKVMRTMRAIQRRLEMLEEYQEQELDRIRAAVTDKTKPMIDHYTKLHAAAETLLRASGQVNPKTGRPKVECPGIGTVRIDLTREHIDTTGWDAMTDEQKNDLSRKRMGAIDVVTKLQPNKKWIKTELTGGDELLATAFKISEQVEVMVFKADD